MPGPAKHTDPLPGTEGQPSDAIYIVEENGRIVTVNPATCRLSGYTEEELLQMNIRDFVLPEDLAADPFRFEELRQGKTVIVQRRFNIKDGKLLQVECVASSLSGGRILVFARDMTDRNKTHNEVLKEKGFSDSIINSLPGVFYLFDEKGKYLRWNKNLETVSGYTAEEIDTMSPPDFFDEEEKELISRKIEEVFTHGMTEVEAFLVTKDKRKIPFYFNGRRLMADGKMCLVGVGIDITEKRKAEALLVESYEDIRRLASHLNSVREEERKRIGREIHDELGQQLTAIKMDMAWIEKKTAAGNTAVREKINNVISLLDGSNRSVRRILTELSPGILDDHGLPAALERLNHQFSATTAIPVDCHLPAGAVVISQDIANCIYRVYQESLTNIMRYAAAANVVTSLEIDGRYIVVTIHDNGKGFDTAQLRSKGSFGILGMKERVLSQKGSFDIRSEPGNGTTITITLPYRE